MENKNSFSWKNYNAAPIVGIVRNMPEQLVYEIAKIYSAAGLSTLEITVNTKRASEIIKNLSNDFPNLNVGAGTVCTLDEYKEVVQAGAQFIVTPIVSEEVIKESVTNGIPIFPGAFTPTEIYKAWTLGASAVKVFPATQLGPSYMKDVLAPLNTIKLLPTGGVSKENIRSFFAAGACGVGMGSSLLDKKMIVTQDFEGLKKHFQNIKNEISDFID